MNLFGTYLKKFPVAVGAGMLLVLLPACNKPVPATPPKPGVTTAGKTNTVAAGVTNLPNQFVSVFDDSLPPENKGRDPFYPNSIRRLPVVVQKPNPTAPVHVDPVFKLGGITGTKGRRLAVINNNYILAVGEDADIRVPTGKVHIHVVEIGEDYAIIAIEGVPGQKRLEMFQNNHSP